MGRLSAIKTQLELDFISDIFVLYVSNEGFYFCIYDPAFSINNKYSCGSSGTTMYKNLRF